MAGRLQIQPLVGGDTPRDGALPWPPPDGPKDSDLLMNKGGRFVARCVGCTKELGIGMMEGAAAGPRQKGGWSEKTREHWRGRHRGLGLGYEACEERKLIDDNRKARLL